MVKNMNEYLRGNKLYGDGFEIEEIKIWYNDETEAYANLGNKDQKSYVYSYHALNKLLAYNKIKSFKGFKNVLSCGGAKGYELYPIIEKCENIVILEPSEQLKRESVLKKLKYVKPNISGLMPFDDEQFDLITCFGTLHHIPNVSTIIKEIFRITRKNGVVLLREPIVSMGDWTKTRKKGVTKRERGIPLFLLRNIIKDIGFDILSEQLCVFGPLAKLGRILNISIYNNRFLILIDSVLSYLFLFNYQYHAINFVKLIRPTSVFYVLRK